MCNERSRAVYHTAGANTGAGTTLVISEATKQSSFYNSLTVINDTDQDIKFLGKNSKNFDVEFIIPKSVRGYTKNLADASTFNLTGIRLISMAQVAAVGNVTLNFG